MPSFNQEKLYINENENEVCLLFTQQNDLLPALILAGSRYHNNDLMNQLNPSNRRLLSREQTVVVGMKNGA